MRWVLAVALLVIAPAAFASECVVLLHGLGRSAWSMKPLQWALEGDGYAVWNESYPSTGAPIEELAGIVGVAAAACRGRGAQRVHFVTHSLGGILVRHYFQQRPTEGIGRVVMLAPPNHGSEIVDAHRERAWFRWATGPAGQQLGSGGLVLQLKPVPLEIGVIAGTASSDPWFSGLFSADHDGKVSVQSAALPEMKEMLVVESGHTFIMNSRVVVNQVRTFLRTGVFEKTAATAE